MPLTDMDRLGIVAGAGRYPLALLEQAARLGLAPSVVAFERVALPAVARLGRPGQWVSVGQLDRAARLLAATGARTVVLAGGVPWSVLSVHPRLDRGSLRLLPRLGAGDDVLLRGVASLLGERGLEVVAPGALAAPLLAPRGPIGGPRVGEHLQDGARAFRAATALGARDAGQAALARGCVLLLEDRRGTDALLRRLGTPRDGGHRRGALAKVAKPGQDPRFDLPAIGPATVVNAARAGLGAILVEAGRTLVIDRTEVTRLARHHGVAVAGLVAADLPAAGI